MFRHTNNPDEAEVKKNEQEKEHAPSSAGATAHNKSSEQGTSDASLKGLIEKNLKWSQIIYEQNRKINNKLLWTAIASWVRTGLILVPLVLGILFLPPLLKGVWSQYGELLGVSGGSTQTSTSPSFDALIKFFNLDPAKQEQIKALLK
ncbi:MAG: hypothetical protein KBC69_01580 [Candidatus Magasanikbacteria bacterium]|nr:hypothetical protein [Candidatus Magasanikbacteria bacterium]